MLLLSCSRRRSEVLRGGRGHYRRRRRAKSMTSWALSLCSSTRSAVGVCSRISGGRERPKFAKTSFRTGSGLCARPRDFEIRLLNVVLANFERSLLPLIVEQTHTTLLVDGQRDSFEAAPNRSSTSPRAFFDNGRARLGGLHSAAWNT